MPSTTDSDVCVDPDFVALRNHRRVSSGRGFPTPSGGEQDPRNIGLPYSRKIARHVRFEGEPVSAKYSKAASMSSTTESSVYIDPIGFLGPLARPVLNHAITATELNSPTANPHPHTSRSSIAASLDHDNTHRADNADPWTFPKLLPSTTQAAMAIIETDARGRALTKRQLGAIRKIVCCPSKCEAEGQSKPIRPPSHRLVLDIAPIGSNCAPSEVSEDPSHRKAKSAWNYPKLEARSPKFVNRPNISEKRKSKAQKPESDVDVMPEFLGGFGDFESARSEPEVILEPAPKPPKKQKGKQGKQGGGRNNQQAQQRAEQSKKQLKKQESLEDEFHASQLYGEYNGDASTERAQLPKELEVQQSPTPSAKFAGWDMAPQEPPPEQGTEGSRRSKLSHHGSHKSASIQAGLEDDWGALEPPEINGSQREAKISQRSGHSYHVSPKAKSSRPHHSQHESQKAKIPRQSSRSHHEAQKTTSIAAGSVAWGEPEGIAGAGAEMWADNPAASLQGSHKDSDHHSKKTTSRHSGSRRSNTFAGDLPLDTIFEDAPLESMKQSSSRRSQAVKSDGRPSRVNEEFDGLDLNEKPASRHSSGSKRSHDLQLRSGDNVDNWEMTEKPASKHGSGSGRSGGHKSRTGEAVDDWAQQEQPSSKHGSTRSGSHRSRTVDVLDGWGQSEKRSSKQGSHQSDGHHSGHSQAVDHWVRPEKPASRQGSHGSSENRMGHSESIDDWDQPDKPVSRQGSNSKNGGRQSRQSGATDDWGQLEKSSSKHGSKGHSKGSKHNEDDVGGGWDSNDRVASRQASVTGGSQAGWDTKISSDNQGKADQGWRDDDGAPSKHGSGSGSHRNDSLKSSSRSNHHEEQEDGRDSRHRSHRSGSGSHKKSSDPRASVSRSPSKKGTTASSYLAPLVEDDPENWHGWGGDGEGSRSKSRSHKSQSEAVVDEWIQGSIKAGSFKGSPVKGNNSPAMALSIGSTATSTTSIDPYAPNLRNDPIESWGAGKIPRDSSVGTRFGRDSPVGSGFGAPPGSAAGWSQSGRVEGETGMGSRTSGSWTSSREIKEAAEQGGWATQTSDGSRQYSHRLGSAREERVGGGWDTQTSSSLEASKVSSRQSRRGEPSSREDSRVSSRHGSSHRSGPENWSQSGRLEGETGKGSRRSSLQSSRQSSRQYEATPVDDGGWNTQASSSQERESRNSKRTRSIRRDVSPAFNNDAQSGGWNNSVQSSRHSGGSRRSRASAAQDDGGWGELAQQGDWGVDVDAPQNTAGGWAGGDERNSNLSRKSGSRGSKGSRRGDDVPKSFF